MPYRPKERKKPKYEKSEWEDRYREVLYGTSLRRVLNSLRLKIEIKPYERPIKNGSEEKREDRLFSFRMPLVSNPLNLEVPDLGGDEGTVYLAYIGNCNLGHDYSGFKNLKENEKKIDSFLWRYVWSVYQESYTWAGDYVIAKSEEEIQTLVERNLSKVSDKNNIKPKQPSKEILAHEKEIFEEGSSADKPLSVEETAPINKTHKTNKVAKRKENPESSRSIEDIRKEIEEFRSGTKSFRQSYALQRYDEAKKVELSKKESSGTEKLDKAFHEYVVEKENVEEFYRFLQPSAAVAIPVENQKKEEQ